MLPCHTRNGEAVEEERRNDGPRDGTERERIAERARARRRLRNFRLLPKIYSKFADFVIREGKPADEFLGAFLRGVLSSLRAYVEDPADAEVTPEEPFLLLEYGVPLDWELWERSGEVVTSLLYKNLMPQDLPVNPAEEDLKDLAERMTGNFLEFRDYFYLSQLTHNVGYVKSGENYAPHLATEDLEALDKLSPEEADARVGELFAPFSLGLVEIEDEDLDEQGNVVPERLEARLEGRTLYGPVARAEGDVDGKPFGADFVLAVYPLVVDPDERRAYFPVMTGLELDGGAPPFSVWSEEDRKTLWEMFEKGFAEFGTTAGEARAETSTFPPPVAAKPPTQKTFPLAFGPTVADTSALELARHAHRVRLPAASWSSLPSWEELQEQEVQRLLREEGDAAFEDLRKKTRDPQERRALLKNVSTDGGRATKTVLTTEGQKRLQIRQGMGKGFRFRDEKDGREYLVRLFQVGRGYLRVGLSWYGMAGPWVEEWNKQLQEQTAAMARGRQQRSLFEELEPEDRERVDRLVRRAQVLRDGRRLMELVLGQVGRQARNTVQIPAQTLRTLLTPAGDKDWKARVEGGLDALRACEFSVRSFDMEQLKGYGTFLAEWWYRGAGPGDHGNGMYYLHVTPGFVGCLSAFESGKVRLSSGREVTSYYLGKTFTKEEKKELPWARGEGGFSNFDAGRVFYSAAQGLSPEQENLVAFLEQELTLRKDPASASHKGVKVRYDAKDAREPRLYAADFCPLLPDGKLFHGALGHFKRSPEAGRSLYGRVTRSSATGGQHSEGLLAVLGYWLPPGAAHAKRAHVVRRALEDLKAVVVDYLGGVVAARRGKEWLSLEEASKLPEKELGQAKWYLFVPETWRADRREKWEAAMKERAARGEEPYAWTVTEDPAEAERARELLHEDGDGEKPLRHLFRAARLDRGLSLAQVGALFRVSKMAVSTWERGEKPIPTELVPLIRRWTDTGGAPTADELAARKTRRPGQGVKPPAPENGGG